MTINIKNTLIKIICYFLIISIILNLFGLYKSVTYIKKISTILLILDIMCCALYLLMYFKESVSGKSIRKITIVLMLLVLYELIVTAITSSFFSYNTPIDICLWPLLFMVFSSYSYNNDAKDILKDTIKKIIILIIVIVFLCFLVATNRFNGLDELGTGAYNTYYCLTFLPLLLNLKANKKGNIFIILLSIIIILFASKRAGIIVAAMSLVVYLLGNLYLAKSFKHKFKNFLMTILIMFIAVIVIQSILDEFNINIIKRLNNIAVDGGSGRTIIWKTVIEKYNNSSIAEKIFGHGYQSVYYRLMPLGKYSLSHNSFIEYLYDYGIVGISLLVMIIAIIIKNTTYMLKYKKTDAVYMSMSIGMMLIFSCISYFFEVSSIILPLAIYWGISIGSNERTKLIKN